MVTVTRHQAKKKRKLFTSNEDSDSTYYPPDNQVATKSGAPHDSSDDEDLSDQVDHQGSIAHDEPEQVKAVKGKDDEETIMVYDKTISKEASPAICVPKLVATDSLSRGKIMKYLVKIKPKPKGKKQTDKKNSSGNTSCQDR